MTSIPRRARALALLLLLTFVAGPASSSQAPAATPAPVSPATTVRFARINEADTRTWLTYLSSDLLQGREVFTEGYGLAAAYVADQLKTMGVRPMGDAGTYFQTVSRRGYKVTSSSSVTVQVNGVTRTFKDGEHTLFQVLAGARQSVSFTGVRFVGDGTPDAVVRAGDLKGQLVLLVPTANTPLPVGALRRTNPAIARANALMVAHDAAAAIGFTPDVASPTAGRTAPAAGNTTAPARPDVTTFMSMDKTARPVLAADESFFDFVLSAAGHSWHDLKGAADKGQRLDGFAIPGATVTITVDNTYQLLTLELTKNVVGMVEGTDPALRDTYVLFGAHLDHVGYAKGSETKGRVNAPLSEDRIWNGADDDGSGSSALLAIAKAFAGGPRPRRSVVFVWHAGEEAGLIGSGYMAENPVVPLDRVQAQLNVDMIGRNRDDDPAQQNTVYLIGADRISTDLHNLLIRVNALQAVPLTLDYEFNDANDPNSFYTRSDHFSYASKGIPITFFFTGEHPDYHANTDTVDKILFPKLVRIAQFIYEAGFSVADSPQSLVRDNRGPRAGRGFSGALPR